MWNTCWDRGVLFSEVDRLVLRAIAEVKNPTLRDLQNLFRLPRRLLLEVLVTLLEEGWLAFDRESRFALTTHGDSANRGEEKSRTMLTRRVRVSIWQEGYCGSLLAGQLPYATQGELKRERHGNLSVWEQAFRLKVRYGQNELDRGIVRQLLREPKEGWIHRITSVEPREGLGGVSAALLSALLTGRKQAIRFAICTLILRFICQNFAC